MIVLNGGRPVNFPDAYYELREMLLQAPSTQVGEWQSQKSEMPMKELLHVAFEYPIPSSIEDLAAETGARLPWAEDHFLERVGGEPLNPSPSEKWWPFRENKRGEGDTNAAHKSEGEAFSHTYPERMWPKYAGSTLDLPEVGGVVYPRQGIRFAYGDLDDVVIQLAKSPNTRQAYLPIWFPEDTGAVHGKRVPCTLGYHFIIRDGKLDVSYFMRSTDLLRHFQDDIYLAARLGQWVAERVSEVRDELNHEYGPQRIQPGKLVFHTANLHIFEADVPIQEYWKSIGKLWY